MDEQIDNVPDLAELAQRAGSIVAVELNSVIAAADRQADEVLRDAERDAEATRREALESAQRVFERIEELERPLREFVQNLQLETDRVERELAGHVDAEATSIASGSESAKAALAHGGVRAVEEPAETAAAPVEKATDGQVADPVADQVVESAKQPVDEPAANKPVGSGPSGKRAAADRPGPGGKQSSGTGKKSSASRRRARNQRARKPQAEHSTEAEPVTAHGDEKAVEQPAMGSTASAVGTDSPEARQPGPTDSPEAKEPNPTTVSPTVKSGPGKLASRLLGRLRDGDTTKGAFITTEGHCSVCQQTFMAGSEADLKQSGWKVNGDVGLCPQCQSDAWQLPEGARLPFRRGGG
ncbi:MAG: hypothetical protein H0U25_09790 [Thermoleophilaceae bacterium]|nr:hypothetical protein [Thermoleophilaceae bacterium]